MRLGRAGDVPLEVVLRHRRHAARAVADGVDEVAQVGVGEVVLAEVRIGRAERSAGRHEPPPRVEAVAFVVAPDRLEVDEVPEALAHLLAVGDPERVGVDALGKRQVERHEQRRPDHRMEPEDLLADHVEVGRPVLRAIARVGILLAETERGRIVEERVDPDVDDVPFVAGHRNAPGEVRPRDGDVLQALPQPPEHLVAASDRPHEVRMRLEVPLEPLGERAQPEVVVRLLRPHERPPGDGALVVELLRLRLGVVLLLAFVVPALELAEVDGA